ncbi:MAG TPA: nitrogenase iron-molybdenum cofactor biosynthesis protein NifN [bacterium]
MLARAVAHACRPNPLEGVCRQRGGESCAYDGAMIVLGCIADAAHLVHGPIACLGNSWESRGTVTRRGELHRRAYTTDLDELDIVYGAADKLRRAILAVAADASPRAIFVYATCVTGMTGEDVGAACRDAEAQLGLPVIPVEAPGFVGPKNLGNRLAGEVLLARVIGTAEPAVVAPLAVNIIGEYNIAGDLDAIEPLLARAGLAVHARITGNATFEEIRRAHRARLNVLVCGRALVNVARGMERRWNVPFVEGSFFGMTETASTLRAMAAALAGEDSGLPGRVDAVIAEEERRCVEVLAPYAGLAGRRAVLYSGGVKSWSLISALRDLGIETVAVVTKKATFEDERKIRALLGPDVPPVENATPAHLGRLCRERGADVLIAGGRNQYLAIKEGLPFVDVNQERHDAYAGYDGLVALARRIHQAIEFFRRQREGAPPAAPRVAPAVRRDLSVTPLRHSPALGAAMALQGIDRAAVLHHGAQGCTFLAKVLLTKHFREPITLVSTKVFAEDLVLGGPDAVTRTVGDLVARQRPDLVAALTSGLSEVRGDDLGPALRQVDAYGAVVLPVSTPDYAGGLEEGYAAAVRALLTLAERGPESRRRVNILAGPGLTPADAREVRRIVGAFGLEATILPDLGALDGSREGFSPLTSGGTRRAEVRAMGSAACTIALGASLAPAAADLARTCGVPAVSVPLPIGLDATDRFVAALSALCGQEVPERLRRERRVLVDGMRDAMTVFGGLRAALALETDAAVAVASLFSEMGATVTQAVVPTAGAGTLAIRAARVDVGDFAALQPGADLLVAGSHGELPARDIGAAHALWGFPVFERLGHCHRVNVGYRGTLALLNDLGNTSIRASAQIRQDSGTSQRKSLARPGRGRQACSSDPRLRADVDNTRKERTP